MKLKITKERIVTDEKIVDVTLRHGLDGIILQVNGWNVFGINSDGIGWLGGNIDGGAKKNSGLQLDNDGQIILEK